MILSISLSLDMVNLMSRCAATWNRAGHLIAKQHHAPHQLRHIARAQPPRLLEAGELCGRVDGVIREAWGAQTAHDGDREWVTLEISADDPEAVIAELWQRAGGSVET